MTGRFRSDISKAKGLGSSHSGVHHWIHQRFTAVLLLALAGWIVCLITCVVGREISEVIDIIQRPYNVTAIALFVTALFYHASLGMQVIIEDYVHCRIVRLFTLFAVQIVSVITVFAMVVAVLHIMTL